MSSFFHTLVVVGAGLSLANCAGKARGEEHAGGGGNNGGGNSGAGGGGAGRPTGGTSSAGTVGSGGTAASGGSISIGGTVSSGGSISTGGSVSSGGSIPFDGGVEVGGMPGMPTTQVYCDPQSFDCTSTNLGDAVVSAVALYEFSCVIDPSRPTSAADCGPGQEFRCMIAVFQEQTLLVNCECSAANAGASCQCPEDAGCIEAVNEICTPGVSLCGCARTCILI
jgi:hypothetical protein